MFLHQALLDNTFGISGEKILSNVSSTIGKLFRYQNQLCALYSVGNSIVINNIDLSQNVLTFNYSSPTQINDAYIDSNTLYFCGKIETQNVGFYATCLLDQSYATTINLVSDVTECNFISKQSNIEILCVNSINQVVLKQIGGQSNTIFQDNYAVVKGYNYPYVFVEVYDQIHSVYKIKVFNLSSNSNFEIANSTKNIFFQKYITIQSVPVIVYIQQDTINNQLISNNLVLAPNSVHLYSLQTFQVVNTFSIPNYFLDCLTAENYNQGAMLTGYAYNSSGTKLNYVSIQIDSSMNLDLSMEGKGYHVELPNTSNYLVPRNKVESVIQNQDIYLLTETQNNQNIDQIMVSKLEIIDNTIISITNSINLNSIVYGDSFILDVSMTSISPINSGILTLRDLSTNSVIHTQDVSSSNLSIPLKLNAGVNQIYATYNGQLILPNGTSNTYQVQVDKKEITVSFGVEEKMYDNTTVALVSGDIIVSGRIDGDDVFVIINSAQFSSSTIGENKVVTATSYDLSGGTANNYRIANTPTTLGNIIQRDVTVSFTVPDKVYDDTTEVLVSGDIIVVGKVLGEDVFVIINSLEYNTSSAGTNKLVTVTSFDLSGGDANNYRIITPITTLANIIKKDISGNLQVEDKFYDGTTGANIISTSLNSVLPNDVVGLTGTAYFLDADIGVNKEVRLYNYSLTGVDALNYNIVSVNPTYASIQNKGVTIYDLSSNYVYGDKVYLQIIIDQSLTSGGVLSLFQTKDNITTKIRDNILIQNGNALIELSGLVQGQYKFFSSYSLNGTNTSSDEINVFVAKRNISLLFNIADKVYDGTDVASLTAPVDISNAVLGDNLSIQNVSSKFLDSNAGQNKIIDVSYQLVGSNVSSYNIIIPSSFASIKPIDLSGTAEVFPKEYDGTTITYIESLLLGGILSNDVNQVRLINPVANFTDPNVGTNKLVNVTGQLIGDKAFNYNFVGIQSYSEIYPAYLRCIVEVNDKVYDGTTVGTIKSVVPKILLSDDTLKDIPQTDLSGIQYNLFCEFNEPSVGDNKSVSVTGLLSGNKSSNYQLESIIPINNPSITRKPVIANIIFEKEYNGSSVAPVKSVDIPGIVTQDVGQVTIDVSNTRFNTTLVGTNLSVNIGSFVVNGTRAFNYDVSVVGSGTILPRNIQAIFSSVNSKVYDGTVNATMSNPPTLTNVIRTDVSNVVFNYTNIQFPDSDVGTKNMVVLNPTLSGSRSSNYTLGPIQATGTILQKDISGSFIALNKYYDSSSNGSYIPESITLNNVLPIDVSQVQLVMGPVWFNDVNAGDDKPVNSTIIGTGLTGSKSQNYRLVENKSKANIFPKPIDFEFTVFNKYFDKTDTATIKQIIYSGIYNTDISDVQVVNLVAHFNNSAIGRDKTVYIESVEVVGSKKNNYEFNAIGNAVADILIPVTFNQPIGDYEDVYVGTYYSKLFGATGQSPFVYDICGNLPSGLNMSTFNVINNVGSGGTGIQQNQLQSARAISGTILETGVFNFRVSASKPNIYTAFKSYTLNVKPLVSIRNNKIFPVETIDLTSETQFDFLDPHLTGYIQKAGIYYSNGEPILLGTSIFDIGLQITIDNPKDYRFIFGIIENPERYYQNIDYLIIFKVFDRNGNLISKLPSPIDMSIYIDNISMTSVSFYVATNPPTFAGQGIFTQRLGTKNKLSCKLTRGDGALQIIFSSGEAGQVDDKLLSVFEHLEKLDRFVLVDYLNTEQLYVNNTLPEIKDKFKTFIINKFPNRIENKKLSEL
jgi:hypothetical protein